MSRMASVVYPTLFTTLVTRVKPCSFIWPSTAVSYPAVIAMRFAVSDTHPLIIRTLVRTSSSLKNVWTPTFLSGIYIIGNNWVPITQLLWSTVAQHSSCKKSIKAFRWGYCAIQFSTRPSRSCLTNPTDVSLAIWWDKVELGTCKSACKRPTGSPSWPALTRSVKMLSRVGWPSSLKALAACVISIFLW